MGSIQECRMDRNKNEENLKDIIGTSDSIRSFIQVEELDQVEDIEVGPIHTQKDAEREATHYEAVNQTKVWTGQWRTTIPGQTSFIQIIKKPAIVRGKQGARGKSFTRPPTVKVRTTLARFSQLQIADHLVFSKSSGETHAIVIDKNESTNSFTTIEFIKGLHNDGGGLFYQNLCVKESNHVFTGSPGTFIVEYGKEEVQSPQITTCRARSYIAKADYDDLTRENGAQALWCKTGKLDVPQVDSMFKMVLRLGFWPLVSLLAVLDPRYAISVVFGFVSFAMIHELIVMLKEM